MDFPDIRFDLGHYIDLFVRWLQDVFGGLFDGISQGILWTLLRIEDFLLFLPWFIIVGIIFVLGWRIISLWTGLLFALLIMLIGTFGYWDFMMYTLAIVLGSVLFAIILGIPIGIVASYYPRMDKVLRPVLDAMQTMPSFVYLIPAMMLFGMGKVPAVFATIVYAIPPVIRLTSLAIRNVPADMVEAAEAFGSSTWQILRKIQLPQALPTIMTGVNQTTMMALSMVVIASMVGAKGLGLEVLSAINRIDVGRGFESGISIVFLAIIIDRLAQGVINKSQKNKKVLAEEGK